MHRALWPLLIASAGCARSAASRAPEPTPCDAPEASVAPADLMALPEPAWGARVVAVEVRGARRVPPELARRGLAARAGSVLEEATVAVDVRALHDLETFEEVVAETEPTTGGVRLVYRVRERPLVGRVEYRGAQPVGRHVRLASGELFDPARVKRAAQGLEDHLSHSGHLDARVTTKKRRRGASVDVCIVVSAGARYLLSGFEPVGNRGIPTEELARLIDDHDGKANRRGAPYRPDLLEPDRLRILSLYYDRGYLNVAVGEPRAMRDPARRQLRVEWPIDEGPVYRIGKLAFRGKLRAPERRYRELLGIGPGETFGRGRVAAGLAEIRAFHERLGHPASAEPETELDPHAHTVDVTVRIAEP